MRGYSSHIPDSQGQTGGKTTAYAECGLLSCMFKQVFTAAAAEGCQQRHMCMACLTQQAKARKGAACVSIASYRGGGRAEELNGATGLHLGLRGI